MTKPDNEPEPAVRIEVLETDYWPNRLSDARAVNHEFLDLSEHFEWPEVDTILVDEARLLGDWFEGRATLDAFEALSEEQDLPDDFLLSGVAEAGTAGAVAVLNVAGCPTFWSCNGEHRDALPNICFWARAANVTTLVAAAKAARVGLVANHGGIEVYAVSRRGLHDFGVDLFKRTARRPA